MRRNLFWRRIMKIFIRVMLVFLYFVLSMVLGFFIYLTFFTWIELWSWSIESEYNSITGYKYKYNERLLKENWGEDSIDWRWDQKFHRRVDDTWQIFYTAGAWWFLERTSSIAYNPYGADIENACNTWERLSCHCIESIWRCRIAWKD